LFDLALAKQARDLCKASYLPALPEGAVPFFMPDGQRRGYFVEIDGVLNRVWAGSSSMFDWMKDAEARPNSAGVHTGAFEVWLASLSSMLNVRDQYPHEIKARDIGHSLGGGLAEIAYCRGASALPPITFEAMRVLTKARTAIVPSHDGMRFVNELDIVPHLPGRSGLWQYAHRPLAYRTCGDSVIPHEAHSLNVWDTAFDRELEGPIPLE